MKNKQIVSALSIMLGLSLIFTGCGKKDEVADSISDSNSTTITNVVNPHKGDAIKYTTAKFNGMRLYYRDFTNISVTVENSNGLDNQDPATSVLTELSLDAKNKVFYVDTQVAVVGNDTIKQPKIFCDASTDTWVVYDDEDGKYKEISDTSELIVPAFDAINYETVEDFLVDYFSGYPLPEQMNGVVEGGIEYYTFSQPANDNDIIGIDYDTLGNKVYELALKPVGDDKYELYHFNVSVNYTIGTDSYKVYVHLTPTLASKDPLALPEDYEEIKIETSEIPGKPLYDNEGNPLLDENGNQIVAPALYNDDGTPMLDENGDQMYDMSVAYGIGEEMPEDMQRAIEEYEAEQTTEQEVPETTENIEETEGVAETPEVETPVEEVQQVVEGQ